MNSNMENIYCKDSIDNRMNIDVDNTVDKSNYDWHLKRFEELTTIELYEILKQRAEVFIVGQNSAYQDMDEKDKKAWHLFLKKDNEIIAYLRILEKGVSYKEISIGRVLTNPMYRRKGYAREMLDKAIEFIEERLNETQIRIFAQNYLTKFYEDKGFVQVSDIMYHDGLEHVEMYRG